MFPVRRGFLLHQVIRLANHFIHSAEAQFGHNFPQFLHEEAEKVDHVFCIAVEAFAQFGVLGGNAYRTGIEVAFAHHDAAFHDQSRRCNPPFLSAQQGSNGNIPASFHLSVGLEDNPAAQFVFY